jgi:hypothetical protein
MHKIHRTIASGIALSRGGLRESQRRARGVKTMGKLHAKQRENEQPVVALRKIALLRKQREFLSAQLEVFERKQVSTKEQIANINGRIREQKKLARHIIDNIDIGEGEVEDQPARKKHQSARKNGSKPKTMSIGY